MFDRFNAAYVMIGAVVLVIAVLHYFLAKKWAWAGAIAPVAYLGFLVWLGMTGRIRGIVDGALLSLGLLALLSYWAKAREAAGKGV